MTAPGGEAARPLAPGGAPAGENGPAAAADAPGAARLAMTEGVAVADGRAAQDAATAPAPAGARGPATAGRPGGGNGSAATEAGTADGAAVAADGAGGAPEDGAIGAGGGEAEPERNGPEVSRFVERFAAVLTEAGIPRMPARVFAALLATDSGRLTAAELAAQLQASPAAVSGGVRYLMGVGMIHREGQPGSRRHHYRVPDHVWDEVVSGRDRLMARWTAVMREGIGLLGADTPAGARLAESVEYFEFVSAELPRVVARWREHKAARDAQAGADR